MTVKSNNRAGWQSGHAADCKSVYAGSIPASASIKNIFNTLKLIKNPKADYEN